MVEKSFKIVRRKAPLLSKDAVFLIRGMENHDLPSLLLERYGFLPVKAKTSQPSAEL
jgi:hypothetical protein